MGWCRGVHFDHAMMPSRSRSVLHADSLKLNSIRCQGGLRCTEKPIRPLLDELDFRFGVFKIGENDFAVIRSAMAA